MKGYILVIDDNPQNLTVVEHLLTQQGYQVHCELDGEDALQTLDANLPDLILLDIMMPEMDGYEVCQRLKANERTKDIPVIFLSVLDEPFDKVKAFRVGGVDYITKPFQQEEVLARIEMHLNLSNIQQQLHAQNLQLHKEIIERKQAEKQLHQQKQLLENTLEAFTYPFYVIDVNDYTIKLANSAAADFMGEITGHPCYTVTHRRRKPCHGTEHPCPLETVKNTKNPVFLEHIHYDKQGKPRYVELHSFPIIDETGSVIQMIEYWLDITRHKQAEEQLKQLTQQLQESNTRKDTFFSILAHDLRSPFSALLGLSEIAIHYIEEQSKEQLKESMELIKASVESAYNLLENLLTWSRLQRGIMEYHPKSHSLHAIVDLIKQLFGAHAEQKQITLQNLVPEETLVYVDENMISTVIRNLVSNALKFTDFKGHIKVTAQQNEHHVEVSVMDTGIGISEDDLSRLFQIDTQLTTTGTAGEKGTGLGLSLCKDLVEKNNGTLWAESIPGQGSTFRFTLPTSPEPHR